MFVEFPFLLCFLRVELPLVLLVRQAVLSANRCLELIWALG